MGTRLEPQTRPGYRHDPRWQGSGLTSVVQVVGIRRGEERRTNRRSTGRVMVDQSGVTGRTSLDQTNRIDSRERRRPVQWDTQWSFGQLPGQTWTKRCFLYNVGRDEETRLQTPTRQDRSFPVSHTVRGTTRIDYTALFVTRREARNPWTNPLPGRQTERGGPRESQRLLETVSTHLHQTNKEL